MLYQLWILSPDAVAHLVSKFFFITPLRQHIHNTIIHSR